MKRPLLHIALMLCLLAAGAGLVVFGGLIKMPAAHAAITEHDQYVYSTADATIYKDRQLKWAVPESAAAVEAGLQTLKAEGYSDIIDRVAGGKASLMKAIAIHESGAGKFTYNQKSGALCAFQIMPQNIEAFAKEEGIKPGEMTFRIMTNKEACVRYGLRILNEAIGSKGDLAMCQYNGQISMMRDTGSCWAKVEYDCMVSIIEGRECKSFVNADKSSPSYGEATFVDSTGAVLGKTLVCKDRLNATARSLAKMADAYKVYSGNIAQETFLTAYHKAMESGSSRLGSVKDTWCLNDILFYMDIIRGLMSGLDAYVALFAYLTVQLGDMVCDYIKNAIITPINNILDSACLPMPDLSASLSMGAVARKACNSGISMGEAIAIQGGMLSQSQVEKGMGAFLETLGIPTLNTSPSYTTAIPTIGAPLRALFGVKKPEEKK